jgi:hypothetical protein
LLAVDLLRGLLPVDFFQLELLVVQMVNGFDYLSGIFFKQEDKKLLFAALENVYKFFPLPTVQFPRK